MKRNKIATNQQEKEQLQKSFENVIKQLQKEEPPLQLPTLETIEELFIGTNKHQETKDPIHANPGSKIKTNTLRAMKELVLVQHVIGNQLLKS